jgi:hypothetical protein
MQYKTICQELIAGHPPPRKKTSSGAYAVGDAAAKATITWLSRDSIVPILFLRSKPLHEKMTSVGVVCGIADL